MSRQITIRQFQRGFYQEIENLPIVVTRRGEPLIVVTKANKANVVTIVNEDDVVTKKDVTVTKKKDIPQTEVTQKELDRLRGEAFT